MSTIAIVIVVAFGVWAGHRNGRSIRGTNIGGLRLAMILFPALLSMGVGALAGFAIADSLGSGALALIGLVAALVGCLIGYLRSR